jgi:hypothetical protein
MVFDELTVHSIPDSDIKFCILKNATGKELITAYMGLMRIFYDSDIYNRGYLSKDWKNFLLLSTTTKHLAAYLLQSICLHITT